MKKYMGSKGYQTLSNKNIVGLHDFWQSKLHPYQKSYPKGQKFSQYAGAMITSWQREISQDSDYKVMIRGFSDGIWHKLTGKSLMYEGQYWPQTQFREQEDFSELHLTESVVGVTLRKSLSSSELSKKKKLTVWCDWPRSHVVLVVIWKTNLPSSSLV